MSDQQELELIFPASMFARLHQVAMHLDASHSWCLQKAWELSREKILKMTHAAGADLGPYVGDQTPAPEMVRFPSAMLQEITNEAERISCAVPWLVQYAWSLSEQAIAKLPPSARADSPE